MRTREVISSIVWIILGVLVCVDSISMRLGSMNRPGPGLFPFVIGCTLILVSIPKIIRQSSNESENIKFWQSRAGVRGVIILFVLLSFYSVALPHLGFSLCTFIFFVTILKTLGQKSWTYALLTGLAVAYISHFLFRMLLNINLPEGPFGMRFFGI
jgi:hypothetical protein